VHSRFTAHPNGSLADKEAKEDRAIEEFCKGMARRFRASYRAVPRVELLKYVRSPKDDPHGATVDGAVLTHFGPVAVECLGYYPLDDRGDVIRLDHMLRNAIGEALHAQLKKRRMWLSVSYRLIPRQKDPPHSFRKAVPKRDLFPSVIEELGRLINDVPLSTRAGDMRRAYFAPTSEAKRWNRLKSARHYVDESTYPMCARYLESVRLHRVHGWMVPEITSDLSVGAVGLDEPWLRRELERKAKKSELSRARANGLPVWLLVHNDGHATNERIPSPHRPRAVSAAREVLRDSVHQFERAYFADETGFLDSAWTRRVF
jgi:hypothetical protein